jgi:2-succinyl-5-enolpyruvyl-6-hydroxy-3-cyclohexene-1-carboxylate synthase
MPLLADPLSGARRGPAAIAHYDALLRDGEWATAHAPDLVLRIGDLPTSKPLRAWLHGLDDALQLSLDPDNVWQDPAGAVATIIPSDPRLTLDAIAARFKLRPDRSWIDAWKRADRQASAAIAQARGWPPSSARCCPLTPPSWSRPRCRCAMSRRSSRPASTRRACSPTAARTG